MLRYYTVFNLDQIEGIEAPPEPETTELEPIAEAERIVSEMQNRPVIEQAGGNKACYYPGKDSVQMPKFQDFDESEKYYSVLLSAPSYMPFRSPTGIRKRRRELISR